MTRDFEKMYMSLSDYENNIHEHNQKRIRIGIKCIIIIPLIFLTLMFLTNSSKVVFLILWIVSLFALAIYLILVEYADYKLQEKLREICGETDKKIKPLIPEVTQVEMKLVETIKNLDLIDITSPDEDEEEDDEEEEEPEEDTELLHHINGMAYPTLPQEQQPQDDKETTNKEDVKENEDNKELASAVTKAASEEKNSEEHNKDISR